MRLIAFGSVLVVLVLLAAGALAGLALADDHASDEAPHFENDEAGGATVEFLEREDHYPGAENVSVRYTLRGGEIYRDVGAPVGVLADRFVVETDAVDHGDCTVQNVAAFGIDRDDDGRAGEYDEDLVQHIRSVTFTGAGVAFEFYDVGDFAGDPPTVRPDDRIVLALTGASSGGGCADTTDEGGFYDATLFLNGTDARGGDGGGGDSETGAVGFSVGSDYTYVCECDDGEEAIELIGPPVRPTPSTETPSGTAPATATATESPAATSTRTQTPTGTTVPKTPTPGGTPVLTARLNGSVGDASVEANASVSEGGVSANVSLAGVEARGEDGSVDPASPTPADAPGFGIAVALPALLGSSLLVWRRTA